MPPAGDCAPPPVQDGTALTDSLYRWIAAHSEYETGFGIGAPPEISFCAAGSQIRYEGRDLLVEPRLHAAYDLAARRIWLVLPWDAGSMRDRSVLLHELVHDVQFRNADWPCPQATEEEAYRLQHDWLAEHGIASGFDWFAIRMRAKCPTGVHP